jgi:hypothetical protein
MSDEEHSAIESGEEESHHTPTPSPVRKSKKKDKKSKSKKKDKKERSKKKKDKKKKSKRSTEDEVEEIPETTASVEAKDTSVAEPQSEPEEDPQESEHSGSDEAETGSTASTESADGKKKKTSQKESLDAMRSSPSTPEEEVYAMIFEDEQKTRELLRGKTETRRKLEKILISHFKARAREAKKKQDRREERARKGPSRPSGLFRGHEVDGTPIMKFLDSDPVSTFTEDQAQKLRDRNTEAEDPTTDKYTVYKVYGDDGKIVSGDSLAHIMKSYLEDSGYADEKTVNVEADAGVWELVRPVIEAYQSGDFYKRFPDPSKKKKKEWDPNQTAMTWSDMRKLGSSTITWYTKA